MSTYKVIQDIEAEDKLVGPLSFRQFVYFLVAAFLFYMSYVFLIKHVGFLMIITLPPALFTGFLAFPFGKDQPTEVWALAKLRFLFKPRKRLWDQSGVKELVTITVPKRIERVLTNGLNQDQVQSRLEALANTIDSRGWAIKNVNVNLSGQNGVLLPSSDRLIDPASLPTQVPNEDVKASDDILDEQSNPIAEQFDHMITASSQAHRKQLIDELNGIRKAQAAPVNQTDYWFMNQPSPEQTAALPADQAMFSAAPVIQPGAALPPSAISAQTATEDEAAIVARAKAHSNSQQVSYAHLRTIQPLGQQPIVATPVVAQTTQQLPVMSVPQAAVSSAPQALPVQQSTVPSAPVPAMPPQHDPAILTLAHNDDLNISTLAREAQKTRPSDESDEGEVVISLR